MVSTEKGETLWQTLYHVPQVAAHAALELTVLETISLVAYCAFELDGHCANPRAATERVAELKASVSNDQADKLCASLHHCSNQCWALCDISVVETIDDTSSLYNWLSAGCLFYRWAATLSD